jgi:uncharacterized protein YjbI with pentapeptide repeats
MTDNQNLNKDPNEEPATYFSQIEDKIREDSKTLRNSYITYLSVAAFVWMIVESITHRQLLLPDESIKLPLFGLEIPVITFFFLAPVILLVFYSYFLIHATRLAVVLTEYKEDMKKNPWFSKAHGSLFTWYFLENENCNWMLKRLTSGFVFLSFWCLVPVIILRTEWQFLPYHNWPLTFLHQTCLTASLILAVYFSRYMQKLMMGVEQKKSWKENLSLGSIYIILTFSTLLMGVFGLAMLKFPGSLEQNIPRFLQTINRNMNLPEASLAIKPGDAIIAKFAGKINESEMLLKYYGTLDLKDRDLRFANFRKTDLRKADLSQANLQGAYLGFSNLQGANFSDASLEGAFLQFSKLQGAIFDEAYLQGANLSNANLQNSKLTYAGLQGAMLRSSNLQGASLDEAKLQGANLSNANLQGVDLTYAKIQATDFRFARLGKLEPSKDQINKEAKIIPEALPSIVFREHIQGRDGKNTNLYGAYYQSLCHNAQQWFKGEKTGDDEPCAPRKEIYREVLLCKFPVLIDQQNNEYFDLFSKEELHEIIEKECPQHLGRVTE